jgi:hypothetical protein
LQVRPLPRERRHSFEWKAANPVSSLRGLAQVKGAGPLVAVVACSGLAQFMLHTCWVLYTTFKFGWGPLENGWSLAAVGVVSAIVQGLLLGRLLRHFSARRLAVLLHSGGTVLGVNVMIRFRTFLFATSALIPLGLTPALMAAPRTTSRKHSGYCPCAKSKSNSPVVNTH